VELPPLVARLVEPPAPAVLPPAAPPQVEPVKPRPRPKPAARRPVAKPAPLPRPEPLPEPPAEAPSAETVEPVAPAPAPVAPPVIARVDPAPQIEAPTAAAVAPPTALPPAAAKVIDPALLAQYRQQLIGAAGKYKRYPRLAMENNWEGHVVVRMAFGGNGLLAGLSIRSSSGYAVLDQQALEMFRQAAKTVEVPPALRGREFTFEVRAIYNLRDQDSG
jgi:protein TonB